MDCDGAHPLSNRDFLNNWLASAKSLSIPVTGGLDLTERCNLRCLHCYLGDQDEIARRRAQELDTEQWCDIIDQFTAAGTLWLLITGGEPLLRNDFAAIYSHAKKSGLLLTIFTNGTMLDEDTVELFRRLPPFKVEITLYGANQATYEKITGVGGSYERCLHGINLLAEAGIRINLKTVLMTHNAHEFEEIQRLANQYGGRFRFDPEIQPRFTGDLRPLDLRVDPEEAIRKDLADPGRRKMWDDYFEKRKDQKPADPERLYACSAGCSTFFIDAYGGLHPCLMVRDIGFDLTTGRFATGWRRIGETISQKKAPVDLVCHSCAHRMVCTSCPAFAKLECGSEARPSPYQCAITQARAAQICKSSEN